MNITLTVSEVKYIISKKLGIDIKKIKIQGDICENTKASHISESEPISHSMSNGDIIRRTGIKTLLKTSLKEQGYESRIPADISEVCVSATSEFIDGITKEEYATFYTFINKPTFKEFSVVWEKYHNIITGKL